MTRLIFLLVTLLLAAPAVAAEEPDEHAGHHAPAAAGDGPGQHDHEVVSATHLQKSMETMRELMAKIRETTDPAEKKRLLGVHMLAMEEQIKTIRAVYAKASGHDHGGKADAGKDGDGKDEGMMGEHGMMDEGGMMGEKGKMGGGMMMKKMHKQMEQRVDALEQLLEQFLEHEAVEEDVEGN